MIGSEDAEGTKPWAARTLQPNPDVVVIIRNPDLLDLSTFFRYVTPDPDSPSRIG